MAISSSSLKKIAIAFAILSFVGYVPQTADNFLFFESGFSILQACIDDIRNIAHWPLHVICFFFSAVFAAFTFLFGTLTLNKVGIGAIIFSLLGVASMLYFTSKVGFIHISIGVYAYIISLFLSFVFSLVGLIKQHEKK